VKNAHDPFGHPSSLLHDSFDRRSDRSRDVRLLSALSVEIAELLSEPKVFACFDEFDEFDISSFVVVSTAESERISRRYSIQRRSDVASQRPIELRRHTSALLHDEENVLERDQPEKNLVR